MNDNQLRQTLRQIDKDPDVTMSSYEASFIESVVFNYQGPMSQKQKSFCEKLIERYER